MQPTVAVAHGLFELRAGSDIVALGQSREGLFNFLLVRERGGNVLQSGNVAPQLMNIPGLGGERFVLPANDFPQSGDRLGGRDIRTSVYSIYEPAVA